MHSRVQTWAASSDLLSASVVCDGICEKSVMAKPSILPSNLESLIAVRLNYGLFDESVRSGCVHKNENSPGIWAGLGLLGEGPLALGTDASEALRNHSARLLEAAEPGAKCVYQS